MSDDINDPVASLPAVVDQPVSTSVPASPGAELARQREARGWTIAEVADQLNLAARQIAALETDNYAVLPGMAIVRGFIRAYAKLLKIDATPLLATMPASPAASLGEPVQNRRALPQPHFSDTRMSGSRYGSNASKWYSLILLFVAIIGGAALAQHFDLLPTDVHSMMSKVKSTLGWTSSATSVLSTDSQSASADTTTIRSDLSDTGVRTDGVDKAAVIPGPIIIPTAPTTAATAGTASVNTLSATADAPAPLTLNAATTLSKTSPAADVSNQLVLNLRDDSWIEIRGPHTTVASKLYRAGATETFAITEPVQLIVGNASGVDATLRGTPLVLQASAKNNVARVNLK